MLTFLYSLSHALTLFAQNDANKDALELASHFKLEKIVGFAKMWQPGGDEGENHNQLYSQLSLELG